MKTLRRLVPSLSLSLLSACGVATPDQEAPPPVAALGRALEVSGMTYSLHLDSDRGSCVDISGGGAQDGAEATLWPCNLGQNQAFRFLKADGSAGAPLPGDEVRIVAKHSGKCLDVYGGSTAVGAAVIQWGCHSGDNQRWIVSRNGAYSFKAKHSGLCLSLDLNTSAMVQNDCSSWAEAYWPEEEALPAGGQAAIYEAAGYAGGYFPVGQNLPNLVPFVSVNFDNKASSASVTAGGEITLYRDEDYRGPCQTVSADFPNLGEGPLGHDSVSSVRLGGHCATATLYEHGSYGGRALAVTEDVPDLRAAGFNDIASALRLSKGTVVRLYSDVSYGGRCQSFTANEASLGSTYVGNDAASSLRFGGGCEALQVRVKNSSGYVARARLTVDGVDRSFGKFAAGSTWSDTYSTNQFAELVVEVWEFGWKEACRFTQSYGKLPSSLTLWGIAGASQPACG